MAQLSGRCKKKYRRQSELAHLYPGSYGEITSWEEFFGFDLNKERIIAIGSISVAKGIEVAFGEKDFLFFDAASSSLEEASFFLSVHKAQKRIEEKRRNMFNNVNTRT